jgi:hypothetical protein
MSTRELYELEETVLGEGSGEIPDWVTDIERAREQRVLRRTDRMLKKWGVQEGAKSLACERTAYLSCDLSFVGKYVVRE